MSSTSNSLTQVWLALRGRANGLYFDWLQAKNGQSLRCRADGYAFLKRVSELGSSRFIHPTAPGQLLVLVRSDQGMELLGIDVLAECYEVRGQHCFSSSELLGDMWTPDREWIIVQTPRGVID